MIFVDLLVEVLSWATFLSLMDACEKCPTLFEVSHEPPDLVHYVLWSPWLLILCLDENLLDLDWWRIAGEIPQIVCLQKSDLVLYQFLLVGIAKSTFYQHWRMNVFAAQGVTSSFQQITSIFFSPISLFHLVSISGLNFYEIGLGTNHDQQNEMTI